MVEKMEAHEQGIRGILVLFVLVVTVFAFAFAFLFLLSESPQPALKTSFEIISQDGGNISVKNTGEKVIKKADLSVFVNGQKADSVNEDIQPGQVGVIKITDQKDALIAVKVGEQAESVPAKPIVPVTIICPAVCVEMWQLKDRSCTFIACGSGCGPDDVATFGTETECRQKILVFQTTTSIPAATPLAATLKAPASGTVNKPFSVTIRAQSGSGINRLALFYGNSWNFYGCGGNQICENTWSITEKAGTYLYYGYVHETKGGNWTVPRHILVAVS